MNEKTDKKITTEISLLYYTEKLCSTSSTLRSNFGLSRLFLFLFFFYEEGKGGENFRKKKQKTKNKKTKTKTSLDAK